MRRASLLAEALRLDLGVIRRTVRCLVCAAFGAAALAACGGAAKPAGGGSPESGSKEHAASVDSGRPGRQTMKDAGSLSSPTDAGGMHDAALDAGSPSDGMDAAATDG